MPPDRLVTRRCPRIYAHEARLLIRFLGEPDLPERVGLDPAEVEPLDGSIPLLSHYDMIEAAVEIKQDPIFGFRFGAGAYDLEESRPGAGALGMLIFASPNLRLSVATLYDHQSWWNPGERYSISEAHDRYFIRYQGWGPRRPAHHQLALRNMASVLGAGALVEGGVSLDWARAAMPRPAGAAEIEAALGCPIEWEAGIDELAFPKQALDSPLKSSDPELFAYAKRVLEEQQSDRLEGACFTVVVRREIDGLGLAEPHRLADELATRLAVSTRTLQRRLSDEGTSLRELIDEARRTHSIELLRGDAPIQEVAHLLGFAETSPFRRAFQRWFGASPTAWREQDVRRQSR